MLPAVTFLLVGYLLVDVDAGFKYIGMYRTLALFALELFEFYLVFYLNTKVMLGIQNNYGALYVQY